MVDWSAFHYCNKMPDTNLLGSKEADFGSRYYCDFTDPHQAPKLFWLLKRLTVVEHAEGMAWHARRLREQLEPTWLLEPTLLWELPSKGTPVMP